MAKRTLKVGGEWLDEEIVPSTESEQVPTEEQKEKNDETVKPVVGIGEAQAAQERAPTTFEEMIDAARDKSDYAARVKAEAEGVALDAAVAYKEARAAWDALFEALKGLRAENAPGYEGSKLSRLLNYIPSVDK